MGKGSDRVEARCCKEGSDRDDRDKDVRPDGLGRDCARELKVKRARGSEKELRMEGERKKEQSRRKKSKR